MSGNGSLATIGIVTALPKECAAVRLMLENEARWSVPGEGAGRDYYVGEVPAVGGGTHHVVIALLPDTGNNNAAIRASQLLNHFPSVRHVIMCGIAGGVPRRGDVEHDVRLGDIVVSNRNGVVQYDLIKERPDRTHEHIYPPRPPGAELLGAVRHLLTEEELGRHPWEAFLARGQVMRHGSRPADNLDAQGELIEYPPDRERKQGLPRVFHGTIAAANNLLRNSEHRDYLSRTFAVKAVEMESSGIADATWTDSAGYLVVRGICDYCDERKGDLWQGAAAVAAAAYVRALIESMPGALPVLRAPQTPPEAIDMAREARYVEQLLGAYAQHLGCPIGASSDLKPHRDLADHFQRARSDFYSAEALRDLTRDSLPPGSFEDLQADVLDAVIDTARAPHSSGYVRVTRTTDQAVNAQITSHALTAQWKPRERKGICHQLANKDKLIWVP